VSDCVPVPVFGNIVSPHLKVVTIGLNPALNEFYADGIPKARSQRLAVLADYHAQSRTDLRDEDVLDAKGRREIYFRDHKRDWHSYFEKMESVLTRVSPAWTYAMSSAAHIDLVACATQNRWSKLTGDCQTALIQNCREHFLASLSQLPNGTVILCDGPRATNEIQKLGLRVEMKPAQLINVRDVGRGDTGWQGDLFLGDKTFPLRGWSSQVSRLPAVWRIDLAFWIHGTLFPGPTWPSAQATKNDFPAKFTFSYGGWENPRLVEWTDGVLVINHYGMASRGSGTKVCPSNEAWRRFWTSVENLNVWRWQPEYNNDQVLDGLQWSLTLEHNGRKVSSEGSNAFPGFEDGPEFPDTCEFAKFLKAIEALTGHKID